MTAPGWFAPYPYAAILLAAAVEGELVFAVAAALVASGQLSSSGVWLAGALGAAAGDQLYFYAFRLGLRQWMDRLLSPEIALSLAARVRRHQDAAILAIRFLPGVRITLAALCAQAGVPAWRFSLLNLASAFVWAAGLLLLVAYAGPRALAGLGIPDWAAAVLPALMLLAVAAGLAHVVRRDVSRARTE
jgi:membrane-associated protein